MKNLHYWLHAESDTILIGPDDQYTRNWCDWVGKVKERSLKELKSLLHADSWVYQAYTDQQLINELGLIDDKENHITIYTDGSGDNAKKNGGFGIVLIYKGEETYYQSDQYINTTSARMEIRGALKALQLIKNKNLPVTLYCDNQYVVNSISLGWAKKWESEDWKGEYEPGERQVFNIWKTLGKRTNYDLWMQVLEEIRKFTNTVEFRWVKGHNGHEYNEICDILAGEARKSEVIIDDSILLDQNKPIENQ